MRLNQYLAQHTELSRRGADQAIADGRVVVNGSKATLGAQIQSDDVVLLDKKTIKAQTTTTTIMLNKPVGYVCSKNGQGSKTIYDILPHEYHNLNPVGRLDKDSSGLLLLTNDGTLANQLTHPRYQKTKVYEVTLTKPLQPLHQQMISDYGVTLEDGPSKFQIAKEGDTLTITMREGRNRQIRRTFGSLGYDVKTLHRTHFGEYILGTLASGEITRL